MATAAWASTPGAAPASAKAPVVTRAPCAGYEDVSGCLRGSARQIWSRPRQTLRHPMEFSRELRNDVLAGEITLTVRLWTRPRVRQGGRYQVGPGQIEVDAIELVPFAAVTSEDVRRAGESDRETLRERAAHAGPIAEDTLVYRIEFHAVSPEG